MLSKEDNELICRVGPGTPMGKLFREYWLPAGLSEELPTPDSDPVRILMLGEKLIAYRDTNGSVGLVQNHCPHRGASLFFGRNEECGLRCVYHGWKFDVDGNCVDMPNEPAESDFKHKVKATAYPTIERGGIIWAYLGTRTAPDLPALPELEGNMLPGAQAWAYEQCANWLQILEGHIDTVHAGILHYGSLKAEDQPPNTFSEYQLKVRNARFEVIDTDAGAAYGAYRPGPEGLNYWRIAQWIFPTFSMAPPGVLGLARRNACEVPMDDEHTITYQMNASRNRPGAGVAGGQRLRIKPNTTEWHGRFISELNVDNDFLLDRAVQRQNEGPDGYTGIVGIPMQDAAVTSSMGAIYDRSQERLGSSDAMVIRVRRRLLEAVKAHEQYGTLPPGVENPEAYRVRSGGVLLPEGADWIEATAELRKAFTEHPELDPTLNGPL